MLSNQIGFTFGGPVLRNQIGFTFGGPVLSNQIGFTLWCTLALFNFSYSTRPSNYIVKYFQSLQNMNLVILRN